MYDTKKLFIDGVLIEVTVSFGSVKTAERLKTLRRIESRARSIVETNSFKFPIGNAWFVPKKRLSRVLSKLKVCQRDFKDKSDDISDSRPVLYWNIYEISEPQLEPLTAYRALFQDRMNTFISEVIFVLRKETAEICFKIITSTNEGKILRGKTLQSLKDFIDRFKEMNFVEDPLEIQLNSIRNILESFASSKNSALELRQQGLTLLKDLNLM